MGIAVDMVAIYQEQSTNTLSATDDIPEVLMVAQDKSGAHSTMSRNAASPPAPAHAKPVCICCCCAILLKASACTWRRFCCYNSPPPSPPRSTRFRSTNTFEPRWLMLAKLLWLPALLSYPMLQCKTVLQAQPKLFQFFSHAVETTCWPSAKRINSAQDSKSRGLSDDSRPFFCFCSWHVQAGVSLVAALVLLACLILVHVGVFVLPYVRTSILKCILVCVRV